MSGSEQQLHIQNELKRRKALNDIIAHVIDKNFLIQGEKYTRRGIVQKAVAQKLGVSQTNELAKAVIDYLVSEGVETVTIHGKNYFKNIFEKSLAITNEDLEAL